MSQPHIRSSLSTLINNYNMKICAINFQLGPRNIDVIGIDDNGDIFLIFLSRQEVTSASANRLINELSEYVWELAPFLDVFQSKLNIGIYLVTPTRTLNIENIYFSPEKYNSKKGDFVRKKIDLSRIQYSFEYIPNGAVTRPSLHYRKRLSHHSLLNIITGNLVYVYEAIFGETLEGKDVETEYVIESEVGNWPADIIIRRKGEIVNIIEVESPLPMDVFLHDKRKESVRNELLIYMTSVTPDKIVVITQRNEPELKELCSELGVQYRPLEEL